jgi:hypothetical protein
MYMARNISLTIRKHVLLMSLVFGSDCSCDQVFNLTKKFRSNPVALLTHESFEGGMWTVTTETGPGIETLVK